MKPILSILLLLSLCCRLSASGRRFWPLEINHVLLNRIELALNNQERSRGLMDRKSLSSEEGMLFIFPKDEITAFWMKNTRTPLDIIFLDSSDTIIALYSMPVEPPRLPYEDLRTYENRLPLYSSRKPARAALELKKGMIQFLQLKTGMKISLNRHLISWPVY